MSRPRPRTLATGALMLLLAVTPFVPRGEDDKGSLLPSGDRATAPGLTGTADTADTAGPSPITPQMQAEIDRVVAAGRAVGRVAGKQTPEQLAASLIRCADFDGQRYCLGTGWTEDSQAQVQARVATAARAVAARRGERVLDTGDLGPLAALERQARMSPDARAAAERQELTDAARAVAKVWLLRHEIEGVPLPADFLGEHPEARADTQSDSATADRPAATASPTRTPTSSPSPTSSPTPTPTRASSATPTKTRADYPPRDSVLDPRQVSEQTQSYWCGPTTMQMIVWGWRDRRQPQRWWAHRLRTTTNGTAITDMVRVVNQSTGWDRESYAGPYITLDISDYSFRKWELLLMRHIHDYRAPVVLHPVLLKRYYPYLDDDASGHFQVGRGYRKRGSRSDLIGYFEPWNQQRFDPSEPYIERVQWRSAYKSYRANEAHFQRNIGV